jgi:tetratricopeptide (TPR) repeat protein
MDLADLIGVISAVLTAVGSYAGYRAWRLERAERQKDKVLDNPATRSAISRNPTVSIYPPLGRLPSTVHGRVEKIRSLVELALHPDGMSRALVGLGGIGKTTVALAVAKEFIDMGRRVWWIPATNGSDLMLALLSLGQSELQIPDDEVQDALSGRRDVADLLWKYLDQQSGWLLVFDNADDPNLLADSPSRLADGTGFARSTKHGMVLITSRHIEPDAWGSTCLVERIGPLSDADSVAMLKELAPNAGKDEQAAALARRLGGLPLALRSVGQHLSSPLVEIRSFKDYLNTFELDHKLARRSIITSGINEDRPLLAATWELSLNALAASGAPRARMLIWILACFAPARPILLHTFDTEPLAACLGGLANMRQTLRALGSVGLIDLRLRDQGGTEQWAVLVHPVVGDVMRAEVADLDTRVWRNPLQRRVVSKVHHVAVSMITNAIEKLDSHNAADWVVWQELIPHLRFTIESTADVETKSQLRRLTDAANYTLRAHIYGGWFESAEDLAILTVAKAERLGENDKMRLLARDNLARIYREKGDLDKAELECRAALALMTKHLGPLHPYTLMSRTNLGRILREKGDLIGAEVEYRATLAGKRSTLGPHHISTLMSWNNIGFVLCAQGRYEEALRETEELLPLKRTVLGEEHPSTLMTWNNKCEILLSLHRLDEASHNIDELLAARQRILGPQHPFTLNTLFDRAKVRMALGLYSLAAADAADVIEGRSHQLGANHPETITARRFLLDLHGSSSHLSKVAIIASANRRR